MAQCHELADDRIESERQTFLAHQDQERLDMVTSRSCSACCSNVSPASVRMHTLPHRSGAAVAAGPDEKSTRDSQAVARHVAVEIGTEPVKPAAWPRS